MSGVVSFGNVVNSLRSVRDDYNEHLKSVPQYEAFLLVDSSTQKVADTLHGFGPAATEVVAALETAKAKFREHLASIPEYRALLAIDKLINDVSADLGVTSNIEPVVTIQAEEAPIDQSASSASSAIEPTSSDQKAISPEFVAEPTSSKLDAVLLTGSPEQTTAPATDAVQTMNAIAEVLAAVSEVGAADLTELASQPVSQSDVTERALGLINETIMGSAMEEPGGSVRAETETFGQAAEKAA